MFEGASFPPPITSVVFVRVDDRLSVLLLGLAFALEPLISLCRSRNMLTRTFRSWC